VELKHLHEANSVDDQLREAKNKISSLEYDFKEQKSKLIRYMDESKRYMNERDCYQSMVETFIEKLMDK
jgi:hypothetical protein